MKVVERDTEHYIWPTERTLNRQRETGWNSRILITINVILLKLSEFDYNDLLNTGKRLRSRIAEHSVTHIYVTATILQLYPALDRFRL